MILRFGIKPILTQTNIFFRFCKELNLLKNLEKYELKWTPKNYKPLIKNCFLAHNENELKSLSLMALFSYYFLFKTNKMDRNDFFKNYVNVINTTEKYNLNTFNLKDIFINYLEKENTDFSKNLLKIIRQE